MRRNLLGRSSSLPSSMVARSRNSEGGVCNRFRASFVAPPSRCILTCLGSSLARGSTLHLQRQDVSLLLGVCTSYYINSRSLSLGIAAQAVDRRNPVLSMLTGVGAGGWLPRGSEFSSPIRHIWPTPMCFELRRPSEMGTAPIAGYVDPRLVIT